jgi:hypothetical protein
MRLLRRGERASTLDLLIAGLGNPGREYARTRHNVGWLVADELARRWAGSFRSKFSGQLAETRVDELRVALLKPETYMNESGRSIGAAVRFFKASPSDLLVVHDDVDLDESRLQARLGGAWPGTTACARSPRYSARPIFSGCGSASAGPAEATGARSRTTCSPRSSPRPTSTGSSRGPPTRARRSSARGWKPPSAGSTDGGVRTRRFHARLRPIEMGSSVTIRAAVVQAAPLHSTSTRRPRRPCASWRRARRGSRAPGAPQAFVSCYPRGLTFGAAVGSRTPDGRAWFRR